MKRFSIYLKGHLCIPLGCFVIQPYALHFQYMYCCITKFEEVFK